MFIWQFTEYREFLAAVLAQRRALNSAYSLRAFARDLGVNPPRMSEILRGKKGLSSAAAAKLAERLQLPEEEAHHFCDLVRMRDARSAVDRKVAGLRIQRALPTPKYLEMARDTYGVLSDWYHLALLELVSTTGFRSNVAWIAQRLTITEAEVHAALQRLKRLKLIEERRGKFTRTAINLTTTNDVPSEAIRAFNVQILRKAVTALESQSVPSRDFSTMTMAIDRRRLGEAKTLLKQFRRQISALLETGERQEVYCLAIQLFALTDIKEKPSEK